MESGWGGAGALQLATVDEDGEVGRTLEHSVEGGWASVGKAPEFGDRSVLAHYVLGGKLWQ